MTNVSHICLTLSRKVYLLMYGLITTILNVDIPTNNRPATNGLAFPFARMITEKEGQHCEEGDHDACDGR